MPANFTARQARGSFVLFRNDAWHLAQVLSRRVADPRDHPSLPLALSALPGVPISWRGSVAREIGRNSSRSIPERSPPPRPVCEAERKRSSTEERPNSYNPRSFQLGRNETALACFAVDPSAPSRLWRRVSLHSMRPHRDLLVDRRSPTGVRRRRARSGVRQRARTKGGYRN